VKRKNPKPPPPKYDRKTAVKLKPGGKVVFKLRTLSLSIANIFRGNSSASDIQQRVSAFLALKIFPLSTHAKFEFESERKNKEELMSKMVDISISNCGTIGARISASIQDKMEEILEERDERLDRDPEDYVLNPHMQFSIATTDLIFEIREVWRVKEAVSSVNEKWYDSYSHQGVISYRTTRQDLFLLLSLEGEPYFTILHAALFNAYKP
jgi:hypothetical protein